MEVRILGPLHAEGNAGIIDLGAPRVQSLLAILALSAPGAVSVEELVDGIWGESPPESAKHLVQVYVSQLRRHLGGSSVTTHAAGYALALPESSIDADAFGKCVQAARSWFSSVASTSAGNTKNPSEVSSRCRSLRW